MSKHIKIGSAELAVFKTILREKGDLIGRSEFEKVRWDQIVVKKNLSKKEANGVFVCSVEGMSFRIDTRARSLRVGIYDPQSVSPGSGCHLKKSPTYLSI